LLPSHQGWGDEEPQGNDKNENTPPENPRETQREKDFQKSLPGFGPEIVSGCHDPGIDVSHHSIKGKDHVGQHNVSHTDQCSRRIEDELNGTTQEPCLKERGIDQSVLSQEDHPGVRPHENGSPEGEEDADRQYLLPSLVGLQKQTRHGIAEKESGQRDKCGVPKRDEKAFEIETSGVLKDLLKMRPTESKLQDSQERVSKKDEKVDPCRPG
jgi:hypothetical protein